MDWTRILPFLLVFVGYYSAEGADISIQPATQKVTIGSQVVFTCESSMAGGTFRWLKSGKDINDEKDLVRIYSPSETISVLRIQRADPSIHRRTYSCVWYSADGITVRENTKLKVLTPSRTHKNFPRISPAVQTSSIDGPLDTSQHFDLKCELTSDVDVTWRWIKDNFTDVSFMDEYNQGHLAIIKEGNSGILRIQQVGADDSGTYTCVADNNRGNAYGTSMKIAIKAEQPDGCTTENQGIVPVGTEFRKDYHDPCTTCQCVENGLIRCKSVGCGVPGPRVRQCRQGFEFRMSNDTCCEYDCFSKGNRSDRVSPVPGQGAGCLTDDKGLVPIGHNWTNGDPCTICECMPEGDVACSAVSCGMPNLQRCRRGQEFRMSDTECCKFGCYPVREQPDGCTTENQGIVPVGTEFRKDYHDPCTTCQCVENGLIRCKSVGCGVPGPQVRRCRQGFEFRMSNDTCCEYDCFSKGNRSDRVSPVPGQGAGCLTDDKGLVPIGHNWTNGDPCTICECMPEGDVACSAVSCGMPNLQRCRRGQEFRMSDTECCKFGCYPVREQPDGCTTENQGIVPVGTEFRKDYHDPCTTCQCVENGLIRCKSVGCGVPGPQVRRCRQGFEFRMSNDTCCEYDCFSKGNRSDRVSPVPGQGAGCLTDDKGLVPIGHNWTNGDPCTICECMPEGDVACSAVSCGMPNMQRCRRGQEFRMSDTECCKFGCYPVREAGSCRDRKGATVQQYEAYRPESDPCVRCQCYKGGSRNCITVACDRPTCKDYIPSTEVCCDYTCPSPAPPNPQKESECISADGSAVTDGTRFTSPDDPCLTCTCFRGKRGPCFSMTCIPPPCLDFDRIPGTCCEYKCPGDQEESYCIDAEGMKVADGETYTPPGDPCQSCSCDRGRQGRCATIYCDVPPCKHELIPGTCCGFKCIAGEGECLDSHGMVVANGDVFTPDGHGSGSCIECVCEEGEMADCVSIVCDEPPCRNYELIPGTCCGFTCRDDIDVVEVDGQTTCVGFGGDVVQDGEPYAPGPDPCVSCTCNKGVGIGCRSVACMPPGPHCTIKPGTCCSFDCNNDNKPLEVLDPVEGQMLVQQVGSSGAIVQWQISEGGTDYMNQGFNFTVHVVEELRRKPQRAVTGSGNRTHIILSDLDSNTQYQLRLNGTLGTGRSKRMLLTKPVMFQLETRSRSSLALNDALGAVFESRGAAHYDTYSIPRQFKPVSQSENVMNHVNVASFHRVEVSTYTQRPCPQDECGLVRFFMYNMEGECMNVMSLMFANDQDYVWAKAHL